jgi:hypothetical protein
MANVTQAKASFKKYEYEDIRTEYFNLTTAATENIPSRQIVTVTSGAVAKTVNSTGHDKGDLLMIAGFEKTQVLVCDGKHRKLEKPKCKNPKHLEVTEMFLDEDSMATNKMLRKILNKIANPGG